MSNGIRVGVVGVGSVAEKYIPQMQRMNVPRQRVDIAVVCDARENRRQVAHERYAHINRYRITFIRKCMY